jgi:DNA processing protein
MYDYRTLLYSLDDSIKISDLKSGEFDHDRDVSGVEQYLIKHDIQAHIDGGQSYHYKTYQISSKPYIYYTIGDTELLSKPMVAIVWPRKPSDYAYRVLDQILDVLSQYDVVTISGMAEWVDEYVHMGSIARGIPTVAVLWAWLATVLRSVRRHVVQKIVDAGWLVYSEFRLKQPSTHYTFPQRNRIVAWYSDCVILPEAAVGSGSLITAEFAMSMSKPLYVTPNSIFVPTSEGTNMLLAEHKAQALIDIVWWADQYFSRRDASTEQWWSADSQKLSMNLSDPEQMIYDSIASAGQWVDLGYVMIQTQMNLVDVQTGLSMLEIYGVVRQSSPGMYSN